MTTTGTGRELPGLLRRTTVVCASALVIGLTLWVVSRLLLEVALVSGSLAVAVLLAALLTPLSERLHRRLPAALAALLSLLVLVGVPVATGLLLYNRVQAQLADLGPALTGGIDTVRSLLTDGPLHLDERQVTQLRDAAVGWLEDATPSASRGAMTALSLLSAAVFVLFAVFFLLKDGAALWRGVVRCVPASSRGQVDRTGRRVWSTLCAYVRGTTLIALADATLIGGALLVLGVPLWLSLTLLTFLAAYVPVLGAVAAGMAAVLVTLLSDGGRAALIVLAVVLVVQQVEGNVLQPWVTSRAVRLHPLVVLTAVSCGTLLLGVLGAVVAVPLLAATRQVVAGLVEDGSSGTCAAPTGRPAASARRRPRPTDPGPQGERKAVVRPRRGGAGRSAA